MATKGAKVERRSVNSSEQYEVDYEAKKTHVSPEKVEAAKKSAGTNNRKAIEKKLKQ